MRILKTLGLSLLPVVAMLASSSVASADQLIAYFEGAYLPQGTYAYNCSLVASTGVRAHIQSYAYGQDIYNLAPQSVYSVQSGVSASTTMAYPGKRHRVKLQSHMIDTGNGEEAVLTHCTGAWTTGWASSGNTNVSTCSHNIYSSTGRTSGACSTWPYTASSMGNNN